LGVKRTIKAREEYWKTHASDARKLALRHRLDGLSRDKLASLSPGEAVIAQYIADGPKYWYDATYDASPLWHNMYVNMDALNRLHDLFEDYALSCDPTRLKAPLTGHYD